jgi:hypothetical protein
MAHNNNKENLFSALPELRLSIAELQQHVADAPLPKRSAMRYSSLVVMAMVIGIGSYFIFGNSETSKKENTKMLTVQEVHPLMLPFIEKKERTSKRAVYGVLLSNKGTAYFKNIDSL